MHGYGGLFPASHVIMWLQCEFRPVLNGGFMESFMTLNIINFVDVTKIEKNGVSWDVRRVSSL